MSVSRQRRCIICHHGFKPDRRVGDRQKVCSRPSCQTLRRQHTQADWRKRHRGYFIAWRAKQRFERNAVEIIDPPRMSPSLSSLPWELAQEEFGCIGADFIASLARKILEHAKDQIWLQPGVITGTFEKEDPRVAKDQRFTHPNVIPGKTPKVDQAVPKDQSPALPKWDL